MATRLYFVATTAPSISPAFGSGWTSTTGTVRRKMDTVKAATTEQVTVNIGTTAASYTMSVQLVSAPLAAQTITGTVTITSRGRENTINANVNKRARAIYVYSGDGNTLRGTLASWVATASTTELSATTLQGQIHANATTNGTLTSVTCQAGDVLVVELGYGVGTSGTSPQGIMEWGGTGTDHANANADTTGTVPWVEFSADLAFQTDLTVADAAQAQTSDNVALDPGVVPWVRDARQGGTGGTNTAINHSVPIPTCNVGDDLFASFTLNGGHGTVGEPAGWTRIFPASIADDTFMTLLIYRKTATATEAAGGTVALTVTTAVRGNSGSVAIVGSDPALAPDGVGTQTGTGGQTSVSQTVNASADNSLVLSIVALDSASENPTPAAPLIQRWDPVEAGITGQANVGATAHRPTAGSATYTWTWTNNLARKSWAASIRSAASSSINLTVADAVQAQTSDSVALTQTHVLTVDAAVQAQTSATVALTQTHVLTVDDATQAQTADSGALTQTHVLTVGDAVQAQTADSVSLSVGGVDLVVADAVQAQTSASVALTQTHVLTVADATQAQTSATVTLAQIHVLTVAPATQMQTADSVALTQLFNLAVDSAAHVQTAGHVTLVDGPPVVRGDMASGYRLTGVVGHGGRTAGRTEAGTSGAPSMAVGSRGGPTITGG